MPQLEHSALTPPGAELLLVKFMGVAPGPDEHEPFAVRRLSDSHLLLTGVALGRVRVEAGRRDRLEHNVLNEVRHATKCGTPRSVLSDVSIDSSSCRRSLYVALVSLVVDFMSASEKQIYPLTEYIAEHGWMF